MTWTRLWHIGPLSFSVCLPGFVEIRRIVLQNWAISPELQKGVFGADRFRSWPEGSWFFHALRLHSFSKYRALMFSDGRTNGRTNGRADRQTDTWRTNCLHLPVWPVGDIKTIWVHELEPCSLSFTFAREVWQVLEEEEEEQLRDHFEFFDGPF